MESIFTSAASVTTVTPELTAQIEAATTALPAAHGLPPQDWEIIEKGDIAFDLARASC